LELETESLGLVQLLWKPSNPSVFMKAPYVALCVSAMALTRLQSLPGVLILLLIVVFFGSLVWSICGFVAWLSGKATQKSQIEQRNLAAKNMRTSSPPPIRQSVPPPLPVNRQS